MNSLPHSPHPRSLLIHRARQSDYLPLGELMVSIYSQLRGFPQPHQQPDYYDMLRNIGRFNEQAGSQLFVARYRQLNAAEKDSQLAGGVVYFSDMGCYGSGGTATQERNASGIRLLGVDPAFRGKGVGKRLTLACIEQTKADGKAQVILHTTQAMETAWRLYKNLGFKRAADLDFMQQGYPVCGFRLRIASQSFL